ncbi:hypothetical protein [Streptomyces sp. NPDC095817]|uniref:hypothetical protein n=1 Tax=Streptomyces sp. NPDC095817 TaxID=3155082 RepID=UPI00331C102B
MDLTEDGSKAVADLSEEAEPHLSEQRWDAVARWPCEHPREHHTDLDGVTIEVGAVIASTTSGRVHALAAALLHGPQDMSRIGYELLAHQIVRPSAADTPLQLLRIATAQTQRPVDQVAAQPVIAAICTVLRGTSARLTVEAAQTAHTMGRDLFASHLSADRSADPRGTVRALLSLGSEYVPDAVGFLTSKVRDPLGSLSPWCAAVRLLRRLPQAVPPVIRLVREVTEATHLPDDTLELCQLLIDFAASDTATEHLLDLAQDASAAPVHRRRAVELLPRGEGRDQAARQARAVIGELTTLAAPTERIALAETLHTLDPQGRRAAIELLFAPLGDVALPAAARQQALGLLATMGPDVRHRLVDDLETWHAGATDSNAERQTALRSISEWGPDLHRAAQGIWESTRHSISAASRASSWPPTSTSGDGQANRDLHGRSPALPAQRTKSRMSASPPSASCCAIAHRCRVPAPTYCTSWYARTVSRPPWPCSRPGI